MRFRLAGLLLVVTVAQAACGESKTPSAPTGAPTENVAIQIAPPPGDAGVVGVSTPLSATVLVNGTPSFDPSRGMVWTSSNSAVARVDERGVLRGVAPGQAVISATTMRTTGTLTVEIVPAVPGTMTLVWIQTDCTQRNAFCWGDVGTARSGPVTMRQVGSGVEGTWGPLQYIQGSPPFSGRIHADGSMELAGSRCTFDDIGRGNLYALTDFRLQRRPDGSYDGSLRHVQEFGCDGSGLFRATTDYGITLRPLGPAAMR